MRPIYECGHDDCPGTIRMSHRRDACPSIKDAPHYVRFPDGSYVTQDRDFYGIGSHAFSPDEIYASRGAAPMRFSCRMNAQNCAWYVKHGAEPIEAE